MKSCITINLKKDDIVIKINEDFSQEDIMYSLRKSSTIKKEITRTKKIISEWKNANSNNRKSTKK